MTDSRTVAAEIARVRAMLDMLDPSDSAAQCIDRLHTLSEVKAQLAAVEVEEIRELQAHRLAEETRQGVARARRGAGLGAEIGLATGQSPARGARCLQVATVLTQDMPQTFAALAYGELSEERAQVVVKEVHWLAPEHRAALDELLGGQVAGLGPRQLAAKVRAHAARLDPQGAVARHEIAAAQRRVTVRPAADGMARVTALVPTQHAVSVLATLTRDANSILRSGDTADPADPSGQERSKAQVMADLFVQRVTGCAPTAIPAEVQLVMTDAALLGDSQTPAWLTGHGPLPATLAKHWLTNPAADVFLRRLFARPSDHQLVAMASRSRYFPPALRKMIVIRDDTCRTPFCDGTIQDIDHVTPAREGGPTTYSNGSGLCASCNQIKENAGWRHQATPTHLTVVPPTGHTYTKPTGPVIEGLPPDTEPSNPGPAEIKSTTDGYTIKYPTITQRIAA